MHLLVARGTVEDKAGCATTSTSTLRTKFPLEGLRLDLLAQVVIYPLSPALARASLSDPAPDPFQATLRQSELCNVTHPPCGTSGLILRL